MLVQIEPYVKQLIQDDILKSTGGKQPIFKFKVQQLYFDVMVKCMVNASLIVLFETDIKYELIHN